MGTLRKEIRVELERMAEELRSGDVVVLRCRENVAPKVFETMRGVRAPKGVQDVALVWMPPDASLKRLTEDDREWLEAALRTIDKKKAEAEAKASKPPDDLQETIPTVTPLPDALNQEMEKLP